MTKLTEALNVEPDKRSFLIEQADRIASLEAEVARLRAAGEQAREALRLCETIDRITPGIMPVEHVEDALTALDDALKGESR